MEIISLTHTDCLVLIVIVLVIVLPLIYVGVPNKAQHDINASTLEVTGQQVMDPTKDSVNLTIDTVIKSKSQFHPTIDAFRAALSLQGQQPFLYIDVPQSKSEGETHITVSQNVNFTSLDAFTQYTKTVLAADTFEVRMDGKPNIHLSGLPTMNVNYNKVITMKGKSQRDSIHVLELIEV